MRIRKLSRHRGALARAGGRARPEEPWRASRADPAARPRQGRVRPDLGVSVDLRVRAPGGGVGPGPDRQLPVLRPLRGSQAQSEVTIADMIVVSLAFWGSARQTARTRR